MISRRTLLKGAAAASVAALVPTLSKRYHRYWIERAPKGRGDYQIYDRPTVQTEGFGLAPLKAEGTSVPFDERHNAPSHPHGVVHLNAHHFPRPSEPYITQDFGNGNVWYSLTGDTHQLVDLERLMHGIEPHTVKQCCTSGPPFELVSC